jgi:hypothetical protein
VRIWLRHLFNKDLQQGSENNSKFNYVANNINAENVSYDSAKDVLLHQVYRFRNKRDVITIFKWFFFSKIRHVIHMKKCREETNTAHKLLADIVINEQNCKKFK